jgi:multidrug efflux pump subunit AcrB
MNPRALATLQLFPKNLEDAIASGLEGYRGGSIASARATRSIEIPQAVASLEDLSRLSIPTPSGKIVHLRDVASVRLAPASTHSRIYRTNGEVSLYLYATPKPGGNIKRMNATQSLPERGSIIDHAKPIFWRYVAASTFS